MSLELDWLAYHHGSEARPTEVPSTTDYDIVKRMTDPDAMEEYERLKPEVTKILQGYSLKFQSLHLEVYIYDIETSWDAKGRNPGVIRVHTVANYDEETGLELVVDPDYDLLQAVECWRVNTNHGSILFCTPRQFEEQRKNVVRNKLKRRNPWGETMAIGGDFCLQIDRDKEDSEDNMHNLYTLRCTFEEFISRYLIQDVILRQGLKIPGVKVARGSNALVIREKLEQIKNKMEVLL